MKKMLAILIIVLCLGSVLFVKAQFTLQSKNARLEEHIKNLAGVAVVSNDLLMDTEKALEEQKKENKRIVALCERKGIDTTVTLNGPMEAWDGFRGIRWGTNIKECKDMVYVKEDKFWGSRYTRKNDKMFLGKIPVKSIVYRYYKDRFYWVRINADMDKEQYGKLQSYVEYRFGYMDEGSLYKTLENDNVSIWFSNKIYPEKTETESVTIYYKPIYSEVIITEGNKEAKEAQSDF